MRPSRFILLTAVIWAAFVTPVQAATVEGKVADAEGKPVAGASVTLIQLTQLSLLTGKEAKPQTFTTDADGGFKFESKDDEFTAMGPEVFQNIIARARIQATGYALTDVMLKAGANAVTLKPATTLQGKVVDEKGAPVPGAVVRWRGLQTPEIQDSAAVTVMFSENLPAPETKTAADGSFTLPGSAVGTKSVLTLEDPRFQRFILAVVPGGDSVTLVARIASTVQGRLLTPDGAPIPHASIWVMQDMGEMRSNVQTGEDGKFVIAALPLGRIRMMPQVPDGEWIGDLRTVEDLKSGEVRDLGDWKLEKGVAVTGQLVDQDTGQPITGASVGAGNGVQRPVPVDAEGRFHFRAKAGNGRFMIMVGNAPYMNTFPPLNVPEGVTTYDAGKIKLQRGEFLEGKVTAEGGESTDGLQIFAYQQGGGGGYKNATVEKDGHFKLGPLSPAKYTWQVSNSRAWEVLDPKEFTVATAGQPQPTLAFKVKKLTVLPARGRVVDTKGAGLPGVKLRLRLARANDGGTTDQNLETDAEGRFTFAEVMSNDTPSLIVLDRDGYEIQTLGKAAKGADAWTFADTVMVVCDASVQGRIKDAAGKPVAGALLLETRAAEKGKEPQVLNASGDFTLTQLAPGEVTLLAAQGREFGRVTGKTGEPAEVTLKAPGTLRQEQLDTLLFGFSRKRLSAMLQYRDAVGDDKLLELAFRLDASQAGGPPEDALAGDNVGDVLVNVARRDPVKAVQWCPQQLERFPQLKSRASVMIPIWLVIAAKGDDAARAEVKLALKEKRVPLPGGERTADAAGQWFALAALASMLDDYHVDEYMDMGLTIADFVGKKDIGNSAQEWGRLLGPGGLKLLGRLEDEWKADVRLKVFCGAAGPLTRFHPDEVPEFLKQLTALAADPAVAAADAELEKTGDGWRNSSRSIGQARVALAGELAATDLNAALAQAALVQESWMAAPAYRRIMDAALAQGNTEAATKAVRASKDAGQTDIQAYMAARARAWDVKLSDEIFAQLQDSAQQALGQNYMPSLASYAFYRAPFDPARSRLVLETEWIRRKSPARTDPNSNNQYFAQIAGAMVALDPARAVEMFNEAPDQWGSKEQPRALILAYMLSTSPQRDLLPVGYAGDN